VLTAMQRTIERSGAGTGGPRDISDTNLAHVQLEAELADLHEKDATLIFTSSLPDGYQTSQRSKRSGAWCISSMA